MTTDEARTKRKTELNRILMALRLELPADVATDACARIIRLFNEEAEAGDGGGDTSAPLDVADLDDLRWAVNQAFADSPITRDRLLPKLQQAGDGGGAPVADRLTCEHVWLTEWKRHEAVGRICWKCGERASLAAGREEP